MYLYIYKSFPVLHFIGIAYIVVAWFKVDDVASEARKSHWFIAYATVPQFFQGALVIAKIQKLNLNLFLMKIRHLTCSNESLREIQGFTISIMNNGDKTEPVDSMTIKSMRAFGFVVNRWDDG